MEKVVKVKKEKDIQIEIESESESENGNKNDNQNGNGNGIEMKDVKPPQKQFNIEEEDEIVKELDVFVSSQLSKQLFLLQYPLRPKKRPYKSTAQSEIQARVKPKARKLEISVGLDVSGSNYNPHKGGELGHVATLLGHDDVTIQNGMLASQLMTSTEVPQKTHYAIGVIREDQLHLSFVNGILQLRPSFKYFDELVSKKKELEEPEEEEEEQEEPEVKAVQVQLKRGESSKTQEAKKKTHAYHQQQIDDETWIKLQYHDAESDEANAGFEKMFTTKEGVIKFEKNNADYINSITSKLKEE